MAPTPRWRCGFVAIAAPSVVESTFENSSRSCSAIEGGRGNPLGRLPSLLFALSFISLLIAGSANSADAIPISLKALSAADRMAVIQFDDGPAVTLSVGDEFADGLYEIRKVLGDRVVVEVRPTAGRPTAELWVYLADEEGHSRIRRIERVIENEPTPVFMVPVEPGERGEGQN